MNSKSNNLFQRHYPQSFKAESRDSPQHNGYLDVFGELPKEPGMASDDKLDLGILEAMADERHEFSQLMEVRETARRAFIREDLSRRVAKAILRKSAPITKEYGVGDLVCFKTEQSG